MSDPNQWLEDQQLPVLDAEVALEKEPQQQDRPKSFNPTPALVSAWQKSQLSQQAPASFMLAMAIFMATTLTASNPAWAAMSGGRVGGGGYGRSAPSMSRPAPSRSYYGGGGGSYSYGYSRRPNVYINPGPTIVAPFAPPIISPFAPVLPYGGGAVAVSRGPSFFDLFFFGAFALVLLNAFRGVTETASPFEAANDLATPLGKGTTVAQISVALQVPNRDDGNSILNVLPRMAEAANTERRAGLQNLTSQVALELLRRKSDIVSAATSHQHFRDRTQGEQAFGRLAIRERSKFEKEGFSKFRGSDWSVSERSSSALDGSKATMAVVTLLIEIDGDSTKLPTVSSVASMEEALRKIASDARVGDCLQSAEILWTPEDRSETLTPREVVADYPELRSV